MAQTPAPVQLLLGVPNTTSNSTASLDATPTLAGKWATAWQGIVQKGD